MEMDNVILDLLRSMDGKIDRISQDVAIVKIKDVEQNAKLDALEEKLGYLNAKNVDIDERLKKLESSFTEKKDIDTLFDKVRRLEETPKTKTLNRIDFVRKAVIAGFAVLITGAIVFLGQIVWKIISHFDSIIEAVELLK